MNLKARAHAILRRTGLGIFKSLLDNEQIEDIVAQWYPQIRRRALTVGSLLGLLAVAQLEKGIDAVEELLRRGWGRVRKAYGLLRTERPVTHQAFSRRLKTLPWQIFRGILGILFATYSEMVRPGQGLYHGLYTLQAIDGSVVDVAARLIRSWAGFPGRGKGPSRKAQAKLHTMFNVSLRVPTLVSITGAKRSEREQARKMVQKALKRGPTIFVFDLGYFAFGFFAQIQNAGGFFVARLKERTRYKILRKFGRRDWLVCVGHSVKGQTRVEVRLVAVREGCKTYWYLTNLLSEQGITVADVRAIYRLRWRVELFFKDLKWVLRASKFFCYNTNGIKIQIYAALSAYVLVRILMARTAQKYGYDIEQLSFKKTMTVLRCWMYTRSPQLWCLRPRYRHLLDLLLMIDRYARATTKLVRRAKAEKASA